MLTENPWLGLGTATHLEGLREEPLDLPGPGDGELILLAELVHAQDSDDVLERLVVLQDLLHSSGDAVVLGADDVGVHDAGGGVQRVHRRVDAQLGDGAGQHSGGVLELDAKIRKTLLVGQATFVWEMIKRNKIANVTGDHSHSLPSERMWIVKKKRIAPFVG